jgi:hypothetical protein
MPIPVFDVEPYDHLPAIHTLFLFTFSIPTIDVKPETAIDVQLDFT